MLGGREFPQLRLSEEKPLEASDRLVGISNPVGHAMAIGIVWVFTIASAHADLPSWAVSDCKTLLPSHDLGDARDRWQAEFGWSKSPVADLLGEHFANRAG